MVSKEIADTVIEIISSESETLSKLSSLFQKSCKKIDQLSVLTSLAALLMDDILEPPQQIITVWLLHTTFSDIPIKDNPFYDVLQFVLQIGTAMTNSYTQKLCDIISCFISSVDLEELGDHSVHEILDLNFSIDSSNSNDLMNIAFSPTPRLSPIIISKADPSHPHITQHQLLRELLIDPSLWTDFDVPFSRQIPDIIDPAPEELQFMTIRSIDPPAFLFDDQNYVNKKEAAKLFVHQASTRKLSEEEINCVLEEVKRDKDFIRSIKIPNKQIDAILDLNYQIGACLLMELARKDQSLYKTFSNYDVTPATVEVVKQVMMNLTPPPKFLIEYTDHSSKIILESKNNQTMKTKLVLFANLMIFLHNNNVPFSADIYFTLQQLEDDTRRKGIQEASLLSSLME